MSLTSCNIVFVLFVALQAVSAFESDVISDLTGSSADEGRALRIKVEQFWQPVLEAASDSHAEEHAALYDEAAVVIGRLPPENAAVRDALVEAVAALRKADVAVSAHAAPDFGSRVGAVGHVHLGCRERILVLDRWPRMSCPRQWTTFLGRRNEKKLSKDVEHRQLEALPAVQGGAESFGDVIGHCITASKRSFEAMKYDRYTEGAPKTPPEAKALADRVVKAAAVTRKRYMAVFLEPVKSLTRDLEGQDEHPSATVTPQPPGRRDQRIARALQELLLVSLKSVFDGWQQTDLLEAT